MQIRRQNRSRGFTLLELMVSLTLLATAGTAAALLLRTGYSAWSAHEQDAGRLEAGHATLRHLVRRIRQGTGVGAISAASELSGNLSILMPSGQTYVWSHNSATDEVHFGVAAATDLLAENIKELNFVAYEQDGTTATTDVDRIQSIVCRVRVDLPVEVGGSRVMSCWAWIRSW